MVIENYPMTKWPLVKVFISVNDVVICRYFVLQIFQSKMLLHAHNAPIIFCHCLNCAVTKSIEFESFNYGEKAIKWIYEHFTVK